MKNWIPFGIGGIIFLNLTLAVGCSQTPALPQAESPSSTPTPTSEAISFANDLQPIFDTNCSATSCHGSGASGGLNLTSSVSYANLVNVASQGYAPNLRVKPSDEANSVLIKKLEGAAGFSSRMPLGGSALSSTAIQKIKDWINQGAKNN